jgi:hypothetical protein
MIVPRLDAQPASGTVYRVVKHSPTQEADFQSHRELNRAPNADPCLRSGLSVFCKKEEAAHMRRVFPKIGDYIAVGELVPHHGVTKLTQGKQPTHTTWWPCLGIDRAAVFAVIEDLR